MDDGLAQVLSALIGGLTTLGVAHITTRRIRRRHEQNEEDDNA